MVSKKNNPVSAVQGGSTGSIILSSAARDIGVRTKSPLTLQASFLAKRYRLRPEIAALVARLAFGEVRP